MARAEYTSLQDEPDPLLTHVEIMAAELEKAKDDYRHAVLLASNRGYSNVAIAAAAKKSEAAIRMYLKRKRQ